jgi:hypothetical protein
MWSVGGVEFECKWNGDGLEVEWRCSGGGVEIPPPLPERFSGERFLNFVMFLHCFKIVQFF